MNKPLRNVFVVVLATVLVPTFWFAWSTREPAYQGRTLTAWLRDIEPNNPAAVGRGVQAQQAVRQIGSNAIPRLLQLLRAHDTKLKTDIVTWLQDQSGKYLGDSQASARWLMAARGFRALGKEGESAVPELRKIILGPDLESIPYAIDALEGIGSPQGVPILLETLESASPSARLAAITSLANHRGRATTAVPDLVKVLATRDFSVRAQAVRALGEIAAQPELTVPALIRCLSDTNGNVRAAAARSLGAFGTNAISALPALRAATDGFDELVWRSVTFASIRVQCEIHEGAIIRGPKDRRQLAIVFTGHEFAEGAETILAELARHHGRASFFLTGTFLTNAQFTSLTARLQDERHYLGPHSDQHLLYCDWDAAHTTRIRVDEFQADLLANVNKLPGSTGEPRRFSRYFLPAFEHYNREIADWSRGAGWTLINFTPGTRANADYTGEADKNFVPSQTIYDSIVVRERDDPNGLNGFILLLHLGSGPGRADKFHLRFGELFDYLAGRGYEFVRVDELLRPMRTLTETQGFRRSAGPNR